MTRTTRSGVVFFGIAMSLGLLPARAFAFTEMIRHGYVNCTSCHVSPAGGGILTAYGRQLSGEILSAAAREGESNFLYGVVKSPDWLNLGGDIRGIQIYRTTPQVTAGRFIFMQADFGAAVTLGEKWTIDASLGYYNTQLQSRIYWLGYRPTDEWSFRAGKFQVAYGIDDPDHTIVTRRDIGWNENSETYNVEAAYLGEKGSVYLTGDFGAPDDPHVPRYKGLAVRPAYNLGDRSQLGVSYFYGGLPSGETRNLGGPFAVLGFTPRFFLLTEWDYQAKNNPDTGVQTGFVTFNRLDYEFTQGLHVYLQGEVSHLAFEDPMSSSASYGLGTQYFPRPHFEFNLLWQRQVAAAFPDSTLNYFTILLHYYL